ncbi:DUF6350 family protein [Actinomycetaceae bacterium L2_0104]
MSNEYRRHLISTVLAVVQPLALSWVTVVILSVFGYVLSASSPMMEGVQWQDAAQLGTSLWLLALGAPLVVGQATIGLMPLVLTACIVGLCYRFLRRVPVFDWVDVGAAALAGALVSGILSLVSLPGTFRLMAILGGGVVVAVGSLLAWWRREPPEASWWHHVQTGWRLLWPLLAGLAVVASVCVVVALATGWSNVSEINGYYVLGTAGTISFALIQLLFLPNLLIWALAFVSGTGFAVGSGTEFSSLGVASAPLPAIPVLGGLPEPGTYLPWLIAVPIVIGLSVGIWRAKRLDTLGQLAGYGASVSAAFLVIVALAGALSSGGIGPGRMESVGVQPPLFAAILTLQTCGGLLLGLLLRNPHLRTILHDARDGRRASRKAARKREDSENEQEGGNTDLEREPGSETSAASPDAAAAGPDASAASSGTPEDAGESGSAVGLKSPDDPNAAEEAETAGTQSIPTDRFHP